MILTGAKRAGRKVRRVVRTSPLYVRHRSEATNVYHVSLPRSGSQWIRGVLRDERVYRHSGLGYFNYLSRFPNDHDPRKLTERVETDPFPVGRIASPLYFSFESFSSIPKPASYRAFFVSRDPRDLLVSWYFSMKKTHELKGLVGTWRAELQRLPMEEGLHYAIRAMDRDLDLFEAMRSWIDAPSRDANVHLVRYEDLAGPDASDAFRRLLEHCAIQLPPRQLARLVSDHSFERKTGRSRGEEDRTSQNRKGVSGDWKNHLAEPVLADLEEFAGDLIEYFGFESRDRTAR